MTRPKISVKTTSGCRWHTDAVLHVPSSEPAAVVRVEVSGLDVNLMQVAERFVVVLNEALEMVREQGALSLAPGHVRVIVTRGPGVHEWPRSAGTEAFRGFVQGLAFGSTVGSRTEFGGVWFDVITDRSKRWPGGGGRSKEELGKRGSEYAVSDVGEFRKALDSRLEGISGDYAQVRDAIHSLYDVSRAAIAERLQGLLNERARQMPHANYEDKKVLATWINEEMRMLGLALRCPRTGAPALLRAQPGGPNGRFAIEVADEQGKRHHTSTTAELPNLVLRPDELGRARWGARTGRRGR